MHIVPEQLYCEGPGTFISHVTVCCHVTDDRDRGEAAILPALPDEKLRRRLWNHLYYVGLRLYYRLKQALNLP